MKIVGFQTKRNLLAAAAVIAASLATDARATTATSTLEL